MDIGENSYIHSVVCYAHYATHEHHEVMQKATELGAQTRDLPSILITNLFPSILFCVSIRCPS